MSKKIKLVPFKEVVYVEREEKIRILEKAKIPQNAANIDFSKFEVDEVVLSLDDGKPRDRFHLLEEAYDDALPRLLALQKRYPVGTFITIGETCNPEQRDNFYNCYPAFYRRDFFSPKLKLEEQILFRSNNKFNTLVVEYMFQYHMSVGLWKDQFKEVCNPHKLIFPAEFEHYKPEPHFVYAKFSRKKINFSQDSSSADSDDDQDSSSADSD